ncbi:hypothetical protein HCTETULN_137 [Candidatus Hodgkinia cicadicola]|nr:hypothetical protein HCTETULN_137 [Candidatus Hodgkinia cicadicola]
MESAANVLRRLKTCCLQFAEREWKCDSSLRLLIQNSVYRAASRLFVVMVLSFKSVSCWELIMALALLFLDLR